MTIVVIPAIWVNSVDIDINAWFASKGGTVISRERTRTSWKITIEETLDGAQQTTLADLIESKFNKVTFE